MILRLEMPFVDPSVSTVRLLRWYVAEDHRVDYGDPVCLVEVEARRGLHRPTARDLASFGTDDRAQTELFTRSGSLGQYIVVASDRGLMDRQCAAVGQTVEIGGLLGLLSASTSASRSQDDPRTGLPRPDERATARFRAVVDTVEPVDALEPYEG